jgi:hypothetical protein
MKKSKRTQQRDVERRARAFQRVREDFEAAFNAAMPVLLPGEGEALSASKRGGLIDVTIVPLESLLSLRNGLDLPAPEPLPGAVLAVVWFEGLPHFEQIFPLTARAFFSPGYAAGEAVPS